MYATFTSRQGAIDFSEVIQTFLAENRPGYHAMAWCPEIKHETEVLWAVPLPPENIEIPEGIELVETLDGWRKNEL